MQRVLPVLACALSLGVPRASAQCPIAEIDELVVNGAAGNERFGVAVSVSGDLALVGAQGDGETASNAGAAYVFRFDGGSWVEEEKLLASDGASGDLFGTAVSISGDTALVGAYLDDDNGNSSGAAYVFVRNGTSWTEQAKLLPDDGQFGDFFGFSVSLYEDTALVSSYLNGESGSTAGAAYVFTRSGTDWSQQDKLLASDGEAGDLFGFSVALFDDTALIGATGDADNGFQSGAAYVFVRSGTLWSEEDKFAPGDGDVDAVFGTSVALFEDTALIGATGDSEQGTDAGAAYVFERDGGDWTEQTKLLPDDNPTDDERFGGAVAMAGDRALVGAILDDGGEEESGAVYAFFREGANWTQTDKIFPADGLEGDSFGSALALEGESMFIGAPTADDPAFNSGSTYAFQVRTEPEVYCTAKTNSIGCLPEIGFVGCPSASDPSGYQVYARQIRNQQVGLFFYSLGARAALPYKGGTLCADQPFYRTPATSSGGNLMPIRDCSGSYRIDMNAFAAGQLGGSPRAELRVPGTAYRGQFWSRDLDDAFGISMTAALESTIAP